MSSNAMTIPVACPCCHRPTESLKQYRLLQFLLFVVVGAMGRGATYTMCPSCMRKQIVKNALVNVLTANLAFPVVFLMFAIQFLRSLTKGHSAAVQEEIDAIVLRRARAQAA